MHALQSWYRSVPPLHLDPDVNTWVLGVEYSPSSEATPPTAWTCADVLPGVLQHVFSLPWFSYRSKFEPVDSSPPMTTDLGWGCMLRSGQMLLAQALMVRYLGRSWRLSSTAAFSEDTLRDSSDSSVADLEGGNPMHEEILRWFYDSSSVPFSIHSISSVGVRYGTVVGQWFGPTTISHVIRDLVERYPPSGIRVYVSNDGCVYRDRVLFDRKSSVGGETSACSSESPDKGLLIIIPLRLGVSTLNETYVPLLQAFLQMPQSVGIIGGRPRSSHFFVGYQGDQVIYLDPHQLQQVSSDLRTYHTSNAGKMRFDNLDPSLAVGFYCHDMEDFEDLCVRLAASATDADMPVVSVLDYAPEYLAQTDDGHRGTEHCGIAELEDFVFVGSRSSEVGGAEEFEEEAVFM